MEARQTPKRKLDDRLLSLADTHSPEEISRELGGLISPARARLAITELLAERDWLTETQEQQLLNHRLKRVISRLEDDALISLEHAKVYLAYLKTIGERMDKALARKQVDLNVLYENQAKMMTQALQIMLAHMRGALLHEIDAEVWDAAVADALAHAKVELYRNVPEEIAA